MLAENKLMFWIKKHLEQKIGKPISQEEVEKLVKFLNRIPEAINKKRDEALDENNK